MAATPKMTIGAGREIETGPDSTALIALLPGMVVQMKSNTVIMIDKLRFVKSGNATAFAMRLRQARIELLRGSIQVVMPVTLARGELEVLTPAGLLTAPETNIFYVGLNDVTVRAVATRGGLIFRDKTGVAVGLSPGYYIEWRSTGDALSEQRRLEDESVASEQAREGFETERRLNQLIPEMRNNRPPG
jgi:hypothetical protein